MGGSDEHIESMMHERRHFPPPRHGSERAHIPGPEAYDDLRDQAARDPEGFWAERAKALLDWDSKWDTVLEADWETPEFKWFAGGKLNACANCLDRHVANGRGEKTALIWQGEPEDDVRQFTYAELRDEVVKFAKVLKRWGVRKGDRVAVYLPMIPELPIAMLACARIGAVHSVVFAGFSAHSLQNRIQDCEAKVLITADAVIRAGKQIPLKTNGDEALEACPSVEHCIVVNRTGLDVAMHEGRDVWWHDAVAGDDGTDCTPESMDAEDLLFILYTSGSTGKPKGVVHTTGGYLTYTAQTTQWVFDIQEDDVYWCTADIGWITGHSYILYGPLALGATTVMFEGVPSYPQPDRFWQVVEKFKVTIFYTAPTVIRALMREGPQWTETRDLSSLRLLGSVGEPINPEAWMWYHDHVGKGELPVLDTWWQTETGGIMISAVPYATTLKPGSASQPLPGIEADIVDREGEPVGPNRGGHLVVKTPWPGMLRNVYGDPARYKSTYFERFPGMYESGDSARMDEEGYFWIMGRLDDVINVSGHRLGTAEIESALVAHEAVAEAAVVGMPHEVKGQAIYAYVTLKSPFQENDELRKVLRQHVRTEIGAIATPEIIQFAPGLPKTRSGKIMRRILRKIAADETDAFGDTSTLADPTVIADLIDGKNLLGR